MSAPGDMIPTWGEHRGLGVVLATSRHKRTYDEAKARRDLEAEGCGVPKVWIWHSHTQRYLDNYGCAEECEVGTWCSEGDGAAWVRVLAAPTEERADD